MARACCDCWCDVAWFCYRLLVDRGTGMMLTRENLLAGMAVHCTACGARRGEGCDPSSCPGLLARSAGREPYAVGGSVCVGFLECRCGKCIGEKRAAIAARSGVTR